MIGKCALCLKENVKLKDSHFLSKGIYKLLRDDREKNPNPWTLTENNAVQTSKQMTAFLLCDCCEQRLSKLGENWVLRNCLKRGGSFPLKDHLDARKPDISSSKTPTKIYYTDKIPEIDSSALAYFAASIFWRGAIYPWNDNGTIPVKLGPYKEGFRRYLAGESGFPKNCALWVVVRDGDRVSYLTHAPQSMKNGMFHTFRFPMPGLAFSLVVGNAIPKSHRDRCFVHGSGKPLFVTSIVEKLLEEAAIKLGVRNPRFVAQTAKKA